MAAGEHEDTTRKATTGEHLDLNNIPAVFSAWEAAVEEIDPASRPAFGSGGTSIKYEMETVQYESRWFAKKTFYQGQEQEELHIKLSNDGYFYKRSKDMPDPAVDWFRLDLKNRDVRTAFSPMHAYASKTLGVSPDVLRKITVWYHDEYIDFLALHNVDGKNHKIAITFEPGYPDPDIWDDWLKG